VAKPYYTSSDLIASIKRKIAMPLAQVTFTDDDILAFLNEELLLSQVPSVMMYHQEYFVYKVKVPLVTNVSRYPIPDRAIGLRLRDLFWSDAQGNFFEMSRISSEDKAFFQRNIGANTAIHKFYLEGNDVVLTPSVVSTPTGYLNFFIFLRPNQLVKDEYAAIVENFIQQVTVDNASLSVGDSITVYLNMQGVTPVEYTFTAVSGSPGTFEFLIGANSIATATNLANAISAAGISNLTATNGTPSTAVVSIKTNDVTIQIQSSNSSGLNNDPNRFYIEFDKVPSSISVNGLVDFLQTKPGHKTYVYDIPVVSVNGTILGFNRDDLLVDVSSGTGQNEGIISMEVGDYICAANECIIPQIPPDLHNGLAERAAARILASLGDQQGLSVVTNKIGEIESRQGTLLDSRVDGAPQKISSRHGLLRYLKQGPRRRF